MNSFIKAVLIATLIAGTLDLTSAYVDVYLRTGNFAAKMLHYIAGGSLGLDSSMQGGLRVQALGLFTHFTLAFFYSLVFFALYPKFHLQQYNKYVIGILYGFLVGMFMTFIVLPMTRLPHNPFDIMKGLKAWLILSFMLGLPISILASRYYAKSANE